MEVMVGFQFRPNDAELVGYYLRKLIEGNTSLVEEAITEVNIYNFDPWDLPIQSKIKSRDPVWYFYSRLQNKYANGSRKNRRASSGSWNSTGNPVDVKDQWGFWSGGRGKIGEKLCVVFKGRGSKKPTSDWVMHEFHYDLLPEHKDTYVICRLQYKGDDMKFIPNYPTDPPTFVPNPTNSEGSVVNRSFQENPGSLYYFAEDDRADPSSNPYVDYSEWLKEYGISDMIVLSERTNMQANRSNHCPKTPVTGHLAYDSSDSETDSMVINTQKSECEWKMAEDSIKKTPSDNTVKHNWIVLEEMSQRNSQWDYLKNMIIGFLLLISIIGWIIVV